MTPVRTPTPNGEADHARASAVIESIVMSGAQSERATFRRNAGPEESLHPGASQ
jgi:hypothetical protein